MQVHASHHVDAGTQAADGSYDFYYEYSIIKLSEGGKSLVARSYVDTPTEVHFLRLESGSARRALTAIDMSSTFCAKAVAYLRAIGKTEITWLSGRGEGYEPVSINAE